MKLHYPTWLKRILLPYEFPDHPLYSDPNAPAVEVISENAEPDEEEEGLRHILGDEFVDRLNKF